MKVITNIENSAALREWYKYDGQYISSNKHMLSYNREELKEARIEYLDTVHEEYNLWDLLFYYIDMYHDESLTSDELNMLITTTDELDMLEIIEDDDPDGEWV